MEMQTEDGEMDELDEEETKQEEHSPQHLPGKPGELQLDLGSASLLLVRDDVVSSASIFSTESEENGGAPNRHNLSLPRFNLRSLKVHKIDGFRFWLRFCKPHI